MFRQHTSHLPRIKQSPEIILRLDLHQPQAQTVPPPSSGSTPIVTFPRLRVDKILQHLLRVRQP